MAVGDAGTNDADMEIEPEEPKPLGSLHRQQPLPDLFANDDIPYALTAGNSLRSNADFVFHQISKTSIHLAKTNELEILDLRLDFKNPF